MKAKATKYPGAMSLKNIHAKTIVKEPLLLYGQFELPREIQPGQGSNFVFKVFKQSPKELGITHMISNT